MHMMIAGIVLHGTVLGVLAFFILFAASKADGFVKLLGNILWPEARWSHSSDLSHSLPQPPRLETVLCTTLARVPNSNLT